MKLYVQSNNINPVVPTNLNVFWDRRSESNVGGEALICQGLSFIPLGSDPFIRVSITHGNTASTLRLNSDARLWYTFLGSGDLVEVVG